MSGYTQDEAPQRTKNLQHGLKAKKLALVSIYKLWSAFTKGLRHTYNVKRKPITVPRIGYFYADQGDRLHDPVMQFIPSEVLSVALGA